MIKKMTVEEERIVKDMKRFDLFFEICSNFSTIK